MLPSQLHHSKLLSYLVSAGQPLTTSHPRRLSAPRHGLALTRSYQGEDLAVLLDVLMKAPCQAAQTRYDQGIQQLTIAAVAAVATVALSTDAYTLPFRLRRQAGSSPSLSLRRQVASLRRPSRLVDQQGYHQSRLIVAPR